MSSQSHGRNQRLKGFKVKQALQLAVLLVICIWLLYQIKYSNNENKELTANVHVKLNKEQTSLGLGRKGDTGRSKNKTDPENEKFNIHTSREDQKEPEREYKDLPNLEENGGKDQVDNSRKLVKGQENDEKNLKGTLVNGSDDSDEDKMANGTISFNDENGFPQDIKEEQRVSFYDEKGDKGALEDSKSGLTSNGEEEKSRDVEDSHSVSIHQELEEVNEKSTQQQDE